MVGHDPTSGEVHHYTYPATQSAFLPQVMTASSDMPAQQTLAAGPLSQPAACMPSSVPPAAALGAGDSSASMMPPENLLASSHHTVPDSRHHGIHSTLSSTPAAVCYYCETKTNCGFSWMSRVYFVTTCNKFSKLTCLKIVHRNG